jgi:hypothetical protein
MERSPVSSPRVIRSAAWVHREYGQDKWPPLLAEIDDLTAGGESSIARVVASLVRREMGPLGMTPIDAAAFGSTVRLPRAAAFCGYEAVIAESVIAACRDDTDAVIELGAGWGRSLLSVWIRGGPRNAVYAGLEYTAAGIECIRRLGMLEPHLKLVTAPFDFHLPVFPDLGKIRHAVVFTVYALHQLTGVEKSAYRALLDAAPQMDMLHFEPIGFQMGQAGGLDQRSRAHALKNGYNLDMWDVIENVRASGDIEVIAAEHDLFGYVDHYPMSLVHWRKTGR